MMHHRLSVSLSVVVLSLVPCAVAVAVEANAKSAARDSITVEEVNGHVAVLADDTFEGREAGTRGNRAAAGYLVERLQKFGLEGGGPKHSFYQTGNGSNNVLALVPGRDEQLKDEVIVIGAHYDHVGYGTYRNSYGPIGRIHNGADDNASGVAALLEVADAVSRLPQKPRRSILFAFWDGEEKGLLGSKYWVEHPTVPLDHVPLAINVDMIGRLRKARLEVFGIRSAAGLRRLVSSQNDVALVLDFDWDIRGDSDHYSFYSRNVPVLMLHTGKHDDYHRPSDDAEKINGPGLAQITQLLFGIVVDAADAPALGAFRGQSRYESNGDKRTADRELPPPPSRLGIRWEQAPVLEGRIVIDRVTPGSPAATVDLRVGDQITAFDGREIRDADQLRMAVLSADKKTAVTVVRPGEDQPLELPLVLAGDPVRLGIGWRTDDAEPDAVIINRITPGSPAEMAGLRSGDRIYRIGGHDISSSDQFHQLARELPPPLVLEVEARGRIRTVEIPHLAESAAGESTDATDGPDKPDPRDAS